MVPGIQMNLFETGMEDHHNVADLFHLVSNSRQVGVWKYGIALCRWVLHSFGYSDFHHQWCLWWEVTTVLPAIGILEAFAHQDEANGKFRHQWFGDDQVCLLQALLGSLTRFAHQSGANENISSPMVWWLQCFATFSWRSKLEEYLYRSLDFVAWLERSLMTCVIASEFRELYNGGCEDSDEFGWCFITVLYAGKTSDASLDISAMRHWFCMHGNKF